MNNLFADIPADLPEELVEILAESGGVRIERIVSQGHASPPAGWYDQEDHEFVVLLSGGATLEFENGTMVSMKPGDWRIIEAHSRHRVAWTEESGHSVWLAVFYAPCAAS